jgi:hypothetical protein
MKFLAGAELTWALASMWRTSGGRSVPAASVTRRKESSMSHQRLLPLSGVAFVALALLAIIAIGGDTPGTSDSVAEIARFYDENEVRQFITSFAFAATVPFLVMFAVGLVGGIAARGDASALWGQVALAGAILVGAIILVTAAIHFALLDAASQDEVAREAVVALNFLDGSGWVAFNAGFGVMMLGAAGLLLSAGVMRSLGWIALVLGVAAFIPVADFFALLATLIWIVVVSVLQARSPKATHSASPAPAQVMR